MCLLAVVAALLFTTTAVLRPTPASAQGVVCGGTLYPSGTLCGNTGAPGGPGGVVCNGVFYPSGTACGTVGASGPGGVACNGIFYPSGTACGNTGPSTLTTISPNQGPPAGGNLVTLTGIGFTGATKVSFGGTSAAFTALSDTQIAATAPPGSGTVGVTVTTLGGISNSVPYRYVLPPPTLTSIFPNGLFVCGITAPLLLTGSGFTGTTNVTFGGTPAQSFLVVADTLIGVIAPIFPPGSSVPVVVTTPGGASNSVTYNCT